MAAPRRRKGRSPAASTAPRAAELRRLREQLLAWYAPEARALPWRGARDPYAIWVSEVMLQQTRVETVRERWGRFLRRFPTLAALAASDEQALLKEWEGLGYYRRARNLRAAAQAVVATGRSALPRTAEDLGRLPGCGPYTAAAVASIAYGEPAAVVDGNVERVLARVFLVTEQTGTASARSRFRDLAGRLLDPRRPGDWNQALMDLGATVCRPRAPLCLLCPWSGGCRGRLAGRAEELPRKAEPKALPHHHIAAGIVWRRGRVLIARRPAAGLLGGLWEFPGGKQREDESLEAACEREVREETGLAVRVVAPFLELDHAYSHFRITLHLFHCQAPAGDPRPLACEEPRFVALSDLAAYPFPRANQRALEALLRLGGPPGRARGASQRRRSGKGTPSRRPG